MGKAVLDKVWEVIAVMQANPDRFEARFPFNCGENTVDHIR